jgi:pSer/pThr/pTyr-binding forkhead associated (FHA) protein
MDEAATNPRLWTLGICAALAAYALLSVRRSRTSDVVASEELGGAPLAFEVEVEENGDRRRYRAGHSLLIGRSPRAAINLSDPTVSRVHARIERRGVDVFVEDLGSRNGTLLNGTSLVRETLIHPGDRVRIGSTDVLYVGVNEWK